ncbi:hypothetical protein AXX12_15040 [Anaerosporomusa subterranea]|uniref:DUF4363 domain-containing protein n=1 Tax=Anaerosporomusa subterranea TaxID=1794912 RepID=A0A154BLV8_ANASB|nr:hypothetical protein [Anaerosporomusa subterranea]KYZ74895.1 hypothetical protein AXX12_15040 [Anaerosporomusa subterranea]
MRNKKLILLSLVAILVLAVATGCGSSDKQTSKSAPSTAAKSASSMPKEDVQPIAQDLERKLKDTGTMVKEGKWAEAKLIAAEALKTNDRLIVHVTDARMKDSLQKSVTDVNGAVNASLADQKSAEAKIATALEALKQVSVQLQGHNH